jgi:nucleotide-binding universal stress UspA family protein|tara:strand:+ start:702 stop:1121 length:420 start_codon:yes stop_codon:yes gene_type:complete
MKYRHILTAIDGSDDSKLILKKSKEITELNNSKSSLVTVLEPMMPQFANFVYVPKDYYNTEEIYKSFVKRGSEYGIEASECHLLRGYPANEINNLIKKIGCDLLVIGSHCNKGLKRLTLGSTASSVLHGLKIDAHIIKV